MTTTHTLTSLALLLLLSACVSPLASLNETLVMWHGGERESALKRSHLEYTRFRDDNALKEEAIRAWAEGLMTRLEEEPIVAKRERVNPLPAERMMEGFRGLDAGIRADLLSHQSSRVARAIGSIAGLGLSQHASALIALIYEPKVIESDGEVLSKLDRAERTLTIKRMALDALERLK